MSGNAPSVVHFAKGGRILSISAPSVVNLRRCFRIVLQRQGYHLGLCKTRSVRLAEGSVESTTLGAIFDKFPLIFGKDTTLGAIFDKFPLIFGKDTTLGAFTDIRLRAR